MNKEYLINKINTIYSNIMNIDNNIRNELIQYCNNYSDISCFVQMILDAFDSSLRKNLDNKTCRYLYSCEVVNYLLDSLNYSVNINEDSDDIDSLYNIRNFIVKYFLKDKVEINEDYLLYGGIIKISIDDNYKEFPIDAIHVSVNNEGTNNVNDVLNSLDKLVNIMMSKDNKNNISSNIDFTNFINKERLISKINEIFINIINKLTNSRNNIISCIEQRDDIAEFIQRIVDMFNYKVRSCDDNDGYRYYCACQAVNIFLKRMNVEMDINDFCDVNSLYKIDKFVSCYLLNGFDAVIKVDYDYSENPIDALHVHLNKKSKHYSVDSILEVLDNLVELMVEKHNVRLAKRREISNKFRKN